MFLHGDCFDPCTTSVVYKLGNIFAGHESVTKIEHRRENQLALMGYSVSCCDIK